MLEGKKKEKEKIEAEIAIAESQRIAREKEARRIALEKDWNESRFTKGDPIAIPCPSEYEELIDDVYGHLRFSVPMIFGEAPDGTMRVRMVKEREAPNCRGFILEDSYDSGGKDSTTITGEMWILNNRAHV